MRALARILLLIVVCSWVSPLFAEEADPAGYRRYDVGAEQDYLYTMPKYFDFVTNVTRDYKLFYQRTFNRENTSNLAMIAASTGILLIYDQQLIDESQALGRRLEIGNGDSTRPFLSMGRYSIFRGPTDIGSSMYYFGDGWTHIGIALSFLGGGLASQDPRMVQTSSQLFEGMVDVVILTQTLKHITGRQSPCCSSQDGGRWEFFPNQIEYAKNVPYYDAYPSGHIATATMTLTVISENYPEYRFIKPLGYTLITLLGYQMMNNGVHWASDYPLGIGMGYLFGKIAVENGRKAVNKQNKDGVTQKTGYFFAPQVGQTGNLYMTVNFPLHK